MKFRWRKQSEGRSYVVFSVPGPWVARIFFRKIHLHNTETLVAREPVILASNHPTAFLEPIMMALFAPAPIYNMTRGDMFAKPFARRLLKGFNMFPVYRMRDGFRGKDRNDQVFEYAIKQLKQRKVVSIFVEGEHHHDRRVKPPKKGIARIAFEALIQHNLQETMIIPCGHTFRYGDRERDHIMMNFGKPIYLADYKTLYEQDPNAASRKLCDDLHEALKALCLHLEHPDDDALAERLLEMHRSERTEWALPVMRYDNRAFQGEKAVTEQLNRLDPATKEALHQKVERYFKALRKAGLCDEHLVGGRRFCTPGRLLFITLGAVPALLGALVRAPLAWPVRQFVRRKVRQRAYKSAVWLGSLIVLTPMYYGFLLLAALLTWNPWWISAALAAPLLSWIYLAWRETAAECLGGLRSLRAPQRAQLLEQRAYIQSLFNASPAWNYNLEPPNLAGM